MADILGLRRLYRRLVGSKPAEPVERTSVTGGHRGVAAGDLEARHAAEQPYTQEEIDKWRTLPIDEVDAFVNDGQILFVHSSNVAAAQYHKADSKMMVEFLNGSAYLYSNVTAGDALAFAQAMSKGAAVWDMFRQRGSRTAHRKPYMRIR